MIDGLPTTWTDVAHGEDGAALERELHREVASGHPLHGLDVDPVARCDGHCDDIALRAGGAWWIVHLVWQGRQRPPWPSAARFETAAELTAAVRARDHGAAGD